VKWPLAGQLLINALTRSSAEPDGQVIFGFVEKEVDSSSPPLPQIFAETPMTEERKHAILFAATLLCARKLIDTIESDKPNFAKQFFIDRAIREVEFVMERIDQRWPEVGEPKVAKLSRE
jgi:hypothetical protein